MTTFRIFSDKLIFFTFDVNVWIKPLKLEKANYTYIRSWHQRRAPRKMDQKEMRLAHRKWEGNWRHREGNKNWIIHNNKKILFRKQKEQKNSYFLQAHLRIALIVVRVHHHHLLLQNRRLQVRSPRNKFKEKGKNLTKRQSSTRKSAQWRRCPKW